MGTHLLVEGHGDDSVEGTEAAGNDRIGDLVEGIVGVDVGAMAARGGGIFANDITVEQAVVVGDKLVGHVESLFVDVVVLRTGYRCGEEEDE